MATSLSCISFSERPRARSAQACLRRGRRELRDSSWHNRDIRSEVSEPTPQCSRSTSTRQVGSLLPQPSPEMEASYAGITPCIPSRSCERHSDIHAKANSRRYGYGRVPTFQQNAVAHKQQLGIHSDVFIKPRRLRCLRILRKQVVLPRSRSNIDNSGHETYGEASPRHEEVSHLQQERQRGVHVFVSSVGLEGNRVSSVSSRLGTGKHAFRYSSQMPSTSVVQHQNRKQTPIF